MQRKTVQISFFLVILAAIFVFLFFIFRPYLGVIFLSAILAVSFHPMYEYFIRKLKVKDYTAGLLTVLVILIAIVIPVTFLSAVLLREAAGLYNTLAFGDGASRYITELNNIIGQVEAFFSKNSINTDFNLESYARSSLGWVINHFDSVFKAVFSGFFKFILMLISLYYLLLHGEGIKNKLVSLSPLPDKYDEEVAGELKDSFDAVLRGLLLVAAGQGLFMGFGFLIFGLGNPVLWGFVAALASFVPIIGTSVLTIPAATYLFISGNFWMGIGMLLWGALAVGSVDNLLSLFFLRGKIKVHPIIILFSILGGVQIFGPLGFLIGPVAVSSFLALGRIYPFIVGRGQSEDGSKKSGLTSQ